MNRSLLVSTTVIAAFTLPVFAVDHHVTTAQELQNALTTAAANAADDSIYLAAGYYQGNFSFTSAEANSLTIEAEPGLTRGEVTLDGAGVGGALNLSSSAVSNFVVRRITIARNCGDANRDALLISTLGTVQINDLASLAANQTGRGIHVAAAASLTIEDSEVSGAGGYIGHGILIEGVGGPITMNRNVVKGNCTYWSTTYGGGIHISGTSGDNIISLDRNTILNNSNSAGWWGKCGGLYIDGGGGTDLVTVTNNTITGNSGAYVSNGGGLMISASSLVLSGNQFSSNASYFSGGGCYFSGGSANILNNSFVSNISLTGTQWNTEGSALKLDCSGCSVTNNVFRSNSGACVMSCSGSTATITSNQFFDNSNGTLLCWGAVNLVSNRFERNSRDNGDMISLGLNGNATVIGNTILDSRVTPGGRVIGISGSSNNTLNFLRNRVTGGNCGTLNASGFGTMLVADNLLAGNNAPNTEGVGAYLQPGGQLDLVNNTITGNSGSAGGGLRINIPGTTEVVHCYNNIIWGNTATGAGSDV
ncbi:MAG: right-handed parallel beta-helix repeat-containing protein, partial [Verrucomicrobiota bacterium]